MHTYIHTHIHTHIRYNHWLLLLTDQLDQHLEGLKAAGVDDIIRVGKRSKSELLKDRNIAVLVSMVPVMCVCMYVCMYVCKEFMYVCMYVKILCECLSALVNLRMHNKHVNTEAEAEALCSHVFVHFFKKCSVKIASLSR